MRFEIILMDLSLNVIFTAFRPVADKKRLPMQVAIHKWVLGVLCQLNHSLVILEPVTWKTQDAETEVTSASTFYLLSHANCTVVNAEVAFQGSRNGAVVRALTSQQCIPGFDYRTRRHMWVELIVGSLPCSERFFSRYSGFPLSSKTNISKFQFDLELWRTLSWASGSGDCASTPCVWH